MLPRVIGFCGKLGSGKTVLTNEFRKKYPEYERLSFAAVLKEEVAQVYNFPLDWCYEEHLKNLIVNKETVWDRFILRIREFFKPSTTPMLPKRNMSVRQILQWYGTDYRRKQDPDYWTKRMQDQIRKTPWCAIDDVRFPNEAKLISKLGGIVIAIEPFPGWRAGPNANHLSETALDDYMHFDLVLRPKYGELNKAAEEVSRYLDELNKPTEED